MERGVRQTSKQDNPKACSLTPLHPNLRDKDIAEIDDPQQKDFHINTRYPPNIATLLYTETERKSQASKLVAKYKKKLLLN